ncbi:slc44a5 [Symbiodinium natans]|uniref:Choline transporter-like protein n=1 Tax=Symbiodinium natans TaxID=878477 RepID=A0A812NUT6_9DINO|nr:slc44a5 [Symbiodinium natans]
MPCTSGPWSGSCSSCVSLYGGSSCNVMMSPKIDATRDDLMSTGFAPSEVTWPLTVNITHVSGSDFNPSVVCPPSKNAGDWQPPEMKLFSLNGLTLAVTLAGMRCCGCLGGMYFCASKKNQEYQNPYWQGGAGGAGGAEGTQLTSQPGGFMSTAAPNGKSWSELELKTAGSDYCGRTEPEIGPNGSLTGRWAECLAWAVVFEHQDTSWERDPRYQTGSGGPAGSVIEAAIAKAPASKVRDIGKAADALEDECRLAVREKRPLPVINERDAAIPDSRGSLYTSANYPNSNLVQNFCRNPFQDTDRYKAKTIWCFTQDPDYNWQECNPIGQIRPICDGGYDISSEELRIVLEIVAYILWVLAFIYCIGVCCLTQRIRLAIAVNKVASVFVVHTPAILVLPAVQALLAGLWTLVWGLSAAFLLSQVPDTYVPKNAFVTYAEAFGTADVPGKCTGTWPTGGVWKDEENCEMVNGTIPACWRCSQPRYGFDWRFAVSFFVYLWNNALNIALGQIIIAGAVVVWFFTKNTNKGNKNAIRRSLHTVFRYHLGSVAFGAFIIAVIQFIRYMLKYYEQQAKAQKNRVLVLILKVLQCLIWCFEKCVKFLNKNAYIQIALMGTNFCTSAKKAFFLILRNALRFGTVAILGGMIHVVGIMSITAATAVLGYFVLSGLHPAMAPAVPILIYIMTGYVVARLFTSIFELAVDTTLQCFLCCEEMKIAELGPDGFVPDQLAPWLDKSQPPEKASEKKMMEETE